MRAWIATFSLLAATATAAERPAPANEALARIAARAEATHSDALLVMRGDDVLLERYAQAKAQPIELMSATKSVVALLVGRLVALGRIESLDQPVHAFYPEWRQGQKQRVTLRMLLNHTSGMQNVQNAGAEIYPAPDVIQLALAAELGTVPGSAFSYNNKAVNLLAGVIERASGVPMDEFARRELFEPLGIEAGPWHKDAAGHPHAMAGLALRAADAAKLGRLVIERGRVGERVLIPEDYLRVMLEPGSTLYAGAGLLWWRRPAFERFHADQETFATMRANGVPEAFVARLARLDGRRFASRAALMQALGEALGAGFRDEWAREIAARNLSTSALFHAEMGPVVAWYAEGYLGQYIVIVPDSRLVAVRQIRRPEDFDDGAPYDNGYEDFVEHVVALSRAPAVPATRE